MRFTVVGGTYREECIEPRVNRLWGSGLRAARLLVALGCDTRLLTWVDELTALELESLAATFGIDVTASVRDKPVRYVYETPVQPAVRDGDATGDAVGAEDDVVLGFGLVEATWSAKATHMVVDPQHSSVTDLLSRVDAAHIALVLNEHEARRLGQEDDLSDAANQLLKVGVDAVVIKRGARGGLVATPDGLHPFGPVPTVTVDPIGSGDAFTAGFTRAWAIDHTEPVAAARFGSRVAAAHSLVGAAAFNTRTLSTVGEPVAFQPIVEACVYLAGPFFSVAQRNLIRVIRRALQHLGVSVFSPLHEIGLGGDEVANKDLTGLRSCSSVLAVLDGSDAGTLFETGWATLAGIPVVGLAESASDHAWTMLRGTGSLVVNDLSTAIYQAAWAALDRAGRE